MSEILTQCKKCNGSRGVTFTTLKEHNPDTTDMNMNVTLQCSCGHIDEYLVTSYHMKNKRKMGRSI